MEYDSSSIFDQDTQCILPVHVPVPAPVVPAPVHVPPVISANNIDNNNHMSDTECDTQMIEDLINTDTFKEMSPKKNGQSLLQICPTRSSPRLRNKRSNSCCSEENYGKKKSRSKRCGSVDHQTPSQSQFSDNDLATVKNKLRHLRTPSPDTSARDDSEIITELSSMNSQNINLRFSPLSPSPNTEKFMESRRSRNLTDSEPIINRDKMHCVPANRSDSADFKFTPFEVPVVDHDTTSSIDMDSPINLNVPPLPLTKNKDYITQYSSSTPENAPFTQSMLLKTMKQHGIAMTDSESESTPPIFSNLKHSTSNKSTPSPLISSTSSSNYTAGSVPTFNIQMYCDENNEFLSLFVVKTNSDLGNDMCKEYQRLSKRLTMDPYAGDNSKSSSPSSITSNGLLTLPARARSSMMSTSSTSSSRTSDGNFVIPQRPSKKLIYQDPVHVKGIGALKNKLTDILTHLSDTYGSDLSSHFEDKHNHSNEGYPATNGHREIMNGHTPRSSKKKTQLRGKRTQLRMRKTILPETLEESQDLPMSMHSPEMMPSNTLKCKSPTDDLIASPKSLKMRDNNGMCSPIPLPMTIDCGDYSIGTLVLAKWTDKRYYSGRINQVLSDGKFSIEFYDGQVKTLLSEFIIFGTLAELPIVGQSVYAMVDKDQNYEPGLILGLEETESGEIKYKCTTDRHSMILVEPKSLYLTEDQAKLIKETTKPCTTPLTPRRRGNNLDLNNIIPRSPRSARIREKNNNSKISSPLSPKASTSKGISAKRVIPIPKKRHESESSEGGDAASIASSTAFEEVAGIQPEVQKTPRKLVGAPAHPLLIKGASKQAIGKKGSKVCKFDLDENSVALFGPIPPKGSTIFEGLCFLLTCTEIASVKENDKGFINCSDSETPYSSASDQADRAFTNTPFHKERLKEQLECGGGTVYRNFEHVPRDKYKVCKLIAPGPCLTAMYIQCLSSNIKAYRHYWIIRCCLLNKRVDMNEDALPTGWSIEKNIFIDWRMSPVRTTNSIFKNKLILFCSELENTAKFWDRVCMMAGANTKIITDIDFDLSGGHVIVTDNECPHEIQNRATLENIPLVSTTWVVQCLIEGRVCDPKKHIKYNFQYMETN